MKTRTQDRLVIYGYYLLAALIIALLVWWEAGLWSECRETNSFWYCMRVLGK